MDFESCAVSSSSTASFPSTAVDSADDRMVDMELEAAEALADLAHLAMIENGGGGGDYATETETNWGCKGKRVRKRVKTESPPGQSGSDLKPDDPEPPCPDPDEERAILDQQQDQTACTNILIKPVKTEQDDEPLKRSFSCTTRYTSIASSRSRQNLTEAEKEERRMRRILANRESARQTIRRRQALCEELTRKADDLLRENENLKREKELAVKEYQSLETINKHLKAHVAKVIKSEVGETRGEVNLAHSEMSSSPTNCPFLLYNRHAFAPQGWPCIIQSPQPGQSQHKQQNAATSPSNLSTSMAIELASSKEQVNNMNNVARTPLFLMPCPWFFPLQDNGNGFQDPTSSNLKVIQDETSVQNGHGSSSSSKRTTDMENHNLWLPVKVKNEACALQEARNTDDVNEFPVMESPQDGGCPQIGCRTREVVSKIANHPVSPLAEKNQEPVNNSSKKLVNAAAAAEARKRRKELTKLKSLHGRQCRLLC